MSVEAGVDGKQRGLANPYSPGERMMKQESMEMSVEAEVGGKQRGLANPDSPGEWMLKQESMENRGD